MSDSVSAFFAKRKDKKHKHTVVKVDRVAEALQKRTREQEEIMAVRTEGEKRAAEEEAFMRAAAEEDEWVGYDDEVDRFEGLKIKDMVTLIVEENEPTNGDDQKNGDGQQSGWGTQSKKKEEIVEEEAKPEEVAAIGKNASAPKAYVAPNRRGNFGGSSLDFQNEELFPTLGGAEEIEKQLKEDKKKVWITKGEPRQEESSGSITSASVSAAMKNAIDAARKLSATSTSTPRQEIGTLTSGTTDGLGKPPKATNAYKPPSRREDGEGKLAEPFKKKDVECPVEQTKQVADDHKDQKDQKASDAPKKAYIPPHLRKGNA